MRKGNLRTLVRVNSFISNILLQTCATCANVCKRAQTALVAVYVCMCATLYIKSVAHARRNCISL